MLTLCRSTILVIIAINLLLFHYAGQPDQWEQTDGPVRCFPPEFFMIIVNAVRTARFSSEPYIYVIVIFVCCILWVRGQLTSHILFNCGSRGSIERDVQVCKSAIHQNFFSLSNNPSLSHEISNEDEDALGIVQRRVDCVFVCLRIMNVF